MTLKKRVFSSDDSDFRAFQKIFFRRSRLWVQICKNKNDYHPPTRPPTRQKVPPSFLGAHFSFCEVLKNPWDPDCVHIVFHISWDIDMIIRNPLNMLSIDKGLYNVRNLHLYFGKEIIIISDERYTIRLTLLVLRIICVNDCIVKHLTWEFEEAQNFHSKPKRLNMISWIVSKSFEWHIRYSKCKKQKWQKTEGTAKVCVIIKQFFVYAGPVNFNDFFNVFRIVRGDFMGIKIEKMAFVSFWVLKIFW